MIRVLKIRFKRTFSGMVYTSKIFSVTQSLETQAIVQKKSETLKP